MRSSSFSPASPGGLPRRAPYIAGLTLLYSPLSALLLMVLGALLSPGHAQVGTETGVVSAVIDGDTLRLADGRSLRLAGIIAPKGDEPFADVARSALARMVLGRRVALAFAQRRLDRHGRLLAQVWLTGADAAPQDWVQGRLLGDGLTRVATTADQREMAAEMLRIEAAARFARRGLWADPAYSVRTADGAAGDLDSFQIFEGRPLAAAVRRGRGYLNFGPDYRTDFTLGFDADALRLLEESDIALQSFEGVRLRVRGWVRWFNGPFIDVTHPEQIEVLE